MCWIFLIVNCFCFDDRGEGKYGYKIISEDALNHL